MLRPDRHMCASMLITIEEGQREVDRQAEVLAARAGAHAVGVAIKPRQAEPVQRRAATKRPRLAVALELDRPSLGQRAGILLALTTLDAINRHVPGTTPVDTRHIGPLQGQLAHCCPVAPAVATQPRSPAAAKPLQHRDSQSAPERIRTSDLRFRSRRLRREFGSSKPNSRGRVARKSPEIKNRDRFGGSARVCVRTQKDLFTRGGRAP